MQKRFSIYIIFHSFLRRQPPPCGHLLPKEGGIDTLETTHILAPSSGRGCLAQRDGVGSPVCWKCVSPVSLSPPLSDIALYKKSTRSGARVLSLAVDLCKNVFPSVSSVFHATSALSALSGHLPLEGKAPIREYPLLKRRRTTLVIPSVPRIVIPSAVEGSLLHCRHMHTCALTQTTPWCFLFRLSLTHGLPLCKKDPSTSALMTRKKDDSLTSSFTPLRRVVPLRGTLSCAFGAGRLASQEGALMGRLGASLD